MSSQSQPTSTQPVSSEEPVSSSSEQSEPQIEPEEGFTLYFRDAKWWNKDAAATYISIDGGGPTAMTHIEYVEKAGYNYWSIVIYGEPFAVTFYRYGTDSQTLFTSYWGAKTYEIFLSDRGENDMYDISASEEAWEDQGLYVQGVWAKYDPNAEPEIPDNPIDPSEFIQTAFEVTHDAGFGRAVYLAGEFNDWAISESYRLEWNQDNVWKGTYPLSEGTYEYKFVIAGYDDQGDPDWDALNQDNRKIEVGQGSLTPSEPENPGGDPIVEGKYAIYSLTDSKVLTVLNKRNDTDYQGREQYEGQLSAKQGDVIELYDLENKAGWIPVIEGWSFGGTSDSDTAYTAYLEPGANGWTVVQDFTASIFAKFAWENDAIYFGLIA